jgi:hypothetical protein
MMMWCKWSALVFISTLPLQWLQVVAANQTAS